MSEIGTATNKKVIDLVNMLKNNTLILKPKFQRNLVWNNKHKESFIDTILEGYPFPEVYFADGDIDLERQVSVTLVVDGQQRLNTIYDYVTGSSDLNLSRIPKFTDLTPRQKTDFFDYLVVVRDLGRIEDEKIKEIFNRINSIQYALNAMEINNALYEGDFIAAAKTIIEAPQLKELEIFNENQYARMKDLELILLIMSTIEAGGYFNANREVETYIREYDDYYPNRELIAQDILDVLTLLIDADLSLDSLWLRKSSFFSLAVELVKLKRAFDKLPNSNKLKDTLDSLENKILENKDKNVRNNKYAKFYNYIFQNTTSRIGRNTRGGLLEEYLKQSVEG